MLQKNNHSIKKSYESITSSLLCKHSCMSVLPDIGSSAGTFYSQCMLPITLPINCWKYLNPWFSLHLAKTEAMCYCPSSHLHAGFFLPDYFCVYALQAPARHKPGSSRCRSAPAPTGAAKGNQLENHFPDPAPLLQGQGSPVQVRSLAQG